MKTLYRWLPALLAAFLFVVACGVVEEQQKSVEFQAALGSAKAGKKAFEAKP